MIKINLAITINSLISLTSWRLTIVTATTLFLRNINKRKSDRKHAWNTRFIVPGDLHETLNFDYLSVKWKIVSYLTWLFMGAGNLQNLKRTNLKKSGMQVNDIKFRNHKLSSFA